MHAPGVLHTSHHAAIHDRYREVGRTLEEVSYWGSSTIKVGRIDSLSFLN